MAKSIKLLKSIGISRDLALDEITKATAMLTVANKFIDLCVVRNLVAFEHQCYRVSFLSFPS